MDTSQEDLLNKYDFARLQENLKTASRQEIIDGLHDDDLAKIVQNIAVSKDPMVNQLSVIFGKLINDSRARSLLHSTKATDDKIGFGNVLSLSKDNEVSSTKENFNNTMVRYEHLKKESDDLYDKIGHNLFPKSDHYNGAKSEELGALWKYLDKDGKNTWNHFTTEEYNQCMNNDNTFYEELQNNLSGSSLKDLIKNKSITIENIIHVFSSIRDFVRAHYMKSHLQYIFLRHNYVANEGEIDGTSMRTIGTHSDNLSHFTNSLDNLISQRYVMQKGKIVNILEELSKMSKYKE